MPPRRSATARPRDGRSDLTRGHEALARNAWEEAREAFEAALAEEESAEALEGLGMAAWWLDAGDLTIASRERAYRLYRARGDARAAGRLAAELAEDHVYFRGRPAAANGWLERARRLLGEVELAPEHGWFKVIEGDLALCVGGDPAPGRILGAEAAAIGRRLGVADIELLGLALQGLALVTEGSIAQGLAQLDEVAAVALAGEMSDPVAIGYACCYLVTGCARARDFARATEWCARVEEFCDETGFVTLFSACRVQHATVLLWRGAWSEAERELTAAVRQLEAAHPAIQAEGLAWLAELRRRQGRAEEAVELVRRAAGSLRGLLVRAELALERGEGETAALLAERFLRSVPVEARTDRLEGFAVALRAASARQDRGHLEAVLGEIGSLAAALANEPAQALMRLAEGWAAQADGDHEVARQAFEDAADAFVRCGAPFEQASAQLELAQELAALGRREAAASEARAAGEAFARLGAEGRARQAFALAAELARSAATSWPCGLTRREVEVVGLVAQGLPNRSIARRLSVSEHTVKRHVANILGKLDLPSRAAAAAFAARHGLR